MNMQRKRNSKAPMHSMLTSTQVAVLLGVTRMTVSRYVREGIIPAPRRRTERGYGYWNTSDVDVARKILESRRMDAA